MPTNVLVVRIYSFLVVLWMSWKDKPLITIYIQTHCKHFSSA